MHKNRVVGWVQTKTHDDPETPKQISGERQTFNHLLCQSITDTSSDPGGDFLSFRGLSIFGVAPPALCELMPKGKPDISYTQKF